MSIMKKLERAIMAVFQVMGPAHAGFSSGSQGAVSIYGVWNQAGHIFKGDLIPFEGRLTGGRWKRAGRMEEGRFLMPHCLKPNSTGAFAYASIGISC